MSPAPSFGHSHAQGTPRSSKWKLVRYVLAAIWFLFTASLSGWWVIFGLQQIDNLMLLKHDGIETLVRHQKMLLWEGGTLFVSLLVGGSALGYYMFKERRQAEQVQRFLATLTHELKTPLASLRLQAESLQDLPADSAHSKELLKRLVADTARLTLRLNNCLFVADATGKGIGRNLLRFEEVSLMAALQALAAQWPTLTIDCPHDALLVVDTRALESILQNILQNAVVHGKATRVSVLIRSHSEGRIMVSFRNNGASFTGDRSKLGSLFARFYSGSGSGIGLYLVRTLAATMEGEARFLPHQDGFEVELTLLGSMRDRP